MVLAWIGRGRWGQVCRGGVTIGFEEETDREGQQSCGEEVADGGERHQAIDADGLFPDAPEERGAAGHEPAAEVQRANC